MSIKNKLVVPGVVAGAVAIGAVGGSMLNAIQASAATDSTSSTSSQSAASGQVDPTKGGHVGANGVKEVLLTGDTADKVKAEALAAVPGGTVLRVENDAEGSTYEAHMTKSDGSQVTVKVDSNFKVTSTESGMGAPGSSTTQQ